MRKLTLAISGALMVLATTLAWAAPFAYFVTPGGNLLVVDTATDTLAKTVAIGTNPFAATVNTAGTRVYATNFGSGSVSVVDTSTHSVITTIPVAAGPQGVAVNPSGTRVYVASFTAGVVPVIDTTSNTVLTSIPLPGAVDVVVNPAGTRLYVAAASGVVVIDTSTNGVLTTIPTGTGSAVIGMAVTPDGAHLYVADIGNKMVLVIDAASNSVVKSIPVSTPFTINGLAFNPAGTTLFGSNGTTGYAIDPATNMLLGTIPLGTTAGQINGVSVAPDGAHVYGATASGVVRIDTVTNAVVNILPGSIRALGHFIGPAVFSAYVVTNNNDSGPGSLRDAIAQSNAATGQRTITFDPTVTGTIVLTSGQIVIGAGPLTIVGPGAGMLAIDGNASNRIFSILEIGSPPCPALTGPNDYLVTISGLTLQNGLKSNSNVAGAIYSGKSLLLDSMIIQNNTARFGGGAFFGAQYPGQTLSVTNSQFLNNTASPANGGTNNVGGGALYVGDNCSGSHTAGTVNISNSLFSGNSSHPDAQQGFGGGIGAFFFGDITITDSRIVDNHVVPPVPPVSGFSYPGGGLQGRAKVWKIVRTEIAQNSADYGGGLEISNGNASLQGAADTVDFQVINSTISGNISNQSGGGMNLYSNVATQVINSTIDGNSAAATRTGGVRVANGAGLTPPTLTLVSSILANSQNNTVDFGGLPSPNIPSPYTVNATNSLIQTFCAPTDCIIGGTGNLTGIDPMVGPLAFNGGPTQTHALLTGSPAINAGSNPLALLTDQRGPGFPRVIGPAADMGAFEASAAVPPVFVSAVSRKVHGAAGTFDLPLSLVVPPNVNHNPTTEPRQGPTATIVFTFDKPISSATATITEGTAAAGAPTFSGNDVVVGLTGVLNQQYVTVSLASVASVDGGTGGSGTVRIGFLTGDVNGSRAVTVADLGLVNAQLAQVVTAGNYLKDINASGTLTVADKGITNANLANALPPP